MRLIIKSIFFGALCLLLMPAISKSQVQNDPFLAFLEESGILLQLKELPFIIEEQFEDEAQQFDEATRARIKTRLDHAFNEHLLIEDARNYLEKNNDMGHMIAVRSWLASPLVQKMQTLEMMVNSGELEDEAEAFFEKLSDNLPPEERIDMIVEFDDITDATFHTVSIITNLYMALAKSMNPYKPVDQQMDPSDRENIKNSIMMQLIPTYRNITIGMNFFTYRDVPDEQLQEYIDFYKTESGMWFVDISYGIFDFVLEQAYQRIGN